MKNDTVIKVLLLVLGTCPFVYADSVATLDPVSAMQAQLADVQQQISAQQNNLSAMNTNLQSLATQLTQLKAQLGQYANPKTTAFKWVDVNAKQTLPDGIFVAAYNAGTALYICQGTVPTDYGSALDPGVLTQQGCVVSYGGQAYLLPQYSVLTANVNGYWIDGNKIKTNSQPVYAPGPYLNALVRSAGNSSAPLSDDNQPTPLYNALAIIGGKESNNTIYICRAMINKQYFIGKVANNTCNLAVGAAEATWPKYEVLLSQAP